MPESPEVIALRLEAEHRRARLMGTAHRLQGRLSPGTLAKGAWQGTKEKGADLAENAVDAIRARPVAATGVAAAIAMFFMREPLIALAARISGSGTKKRKAGKPERVKAESAKPETAKPARARSTRIKSARAVMEKVP